MNRADWLPLIALGACRGGRLLAAAALACALFALASLTSAPFAAGILWTLVVLLTLPALYFGVRLELDRGLFQRLAERPPSSGEDLAELDRALSELGFIAKSTDHRTLVDRIGGTLRLLRRLGGVVIVQIMLLLLAAWLR